MGKRSKNRAHKRHLQTLPVNVGARQFAKRHGLRVFAASPGDWYLFNRKTGVQIGRWFVKHGTLHLFGGVAPKARTIEDVVRLICEMYPAELTEQSVREMTGAGEGGSGLPLPPGATVNCGPQGA